jgi:hypothetical protein
MSSPFSSARPASRSSVPVHTQRETPDERNCSTAMLGRVLGNLFARLALRVVSSRLPGRPSLRRSLPWLTSFRVSHSIMMPSDNPDPPHRLLVSLAAMSSTTPHTEMQFGPSWLKPTSRQKSAKTAQQPPAPAEPSPISYSAITRDHPTPMSPESADPNGGSLDHIVDPSKPFRYSKEYMLGLYDEHKQKGRELPFDFERWGVVFREEGGNPISLSPLTEMEKKVSSPGCDPSLPSSSPGADLCRSFIQSAVRSSVQP